MQAWLQLRVGFYDAPAHEMNIDRVIVYLFTLPILDHRSGKTDLTFSSEAMKYLDVLLLPPFMRTSIAMVPDGTSWWEQSFVVSS